MTLGVALASGVLMESELPALDEHAPTARLTEQIRARTRRGLLRVARVTTNRRSVSAYHGPRQPSPRFGAQIGSSGGLPDAADVFTSGEHTTKDGGPRSEREGEDGRPASRRELVD
jgi:hypothetical protein